MKVARRQQITEVVTHRHVSHTLIHEGVKYRRIEKTKVIVPSMDCDTIIVQEPKFFWSKYVAERTVQDIPKRETKKLETLFQALDKNDLNGNGDYIIPDVTF